MVQDQTVLVVEVREVFAQVQVLPLLQERPIQLQLGRVGQAVVM